MGIENIVFPVTALIGVSALTEATVEIVKSVVPVRLTENGTKIIALLISVILAFALNTSIINLTGPAHYVGIVLAGLIASRGSNYIHALSDMLETIKTNVIK